MTTHPNPHEFQKSADYYDRKYYRDVSQSPPMTRHLRRLAVKLGLGEGIRLLDIACGTGAWLRAVQGAGALPYGIDISRHAAATCARSIGPDKVMVGTAEQLPYRDGLFDVVTCLGALEHFLDQQQALAEMVRVAAPEGRFLILVPNAGFLTYRLGLYRGTHQVTHRETIYSLDKWENVFSRAGLTVEERWKDLHVFSFAWMLRKPWYAPPARLLQAVLLLLWPLKWQYQVYHLCRRVTG
ncbi:hypothetical protein D3OALGA1CA_1072 [Olavius algarvensis associated proteobacterium Delta 3]|nr:hypothetical protein D3OALGA1CA_1072 [Olavius algarvensis associated proteobacterium Delta 3]CAB5139687.1 hypothetical protein D3OALGB2SA_4160 [Olavius algarvensis associated proteobacterium Delta 3]